MFRTTMLSALAVASLCVAGSAGAQTAPQGAPAGTDPMMMPTTAPDYVKAAGAGDKFEIDSSKLVLQSTKDAQVRSFAHKMIADHTKSTAMVKVAARKDGVAVMPPMLNPMQTQMLDDIRAATGKARDAVYMQDQGTSHDASLQVQQSYASGGDKPALMATAAKIVPVVQSHIDMLNAMPKTAAM
ncbi:DUF4142 domain-containing protein [Sphingomonas bacterium]|uniref:DUF4142 domain-containing protein n=1 Tax=Sphingomonas bacterium TaxID=1895847 RepID=UPI001575ABBB|nr:DUF4142 domain-containing protein [Sphingomonas bacterium]